METINAKVKPSVVYGVKSQITKNDYSIKGVVRQLGTLIPCRVRLFEKISGRLVSDIQTDGNGNYEFTNLPNNNFFIVAHHPASQFNAVIQDNVVPK